MRGNEEEIDKIPESSNKPSTSYNPITGNADTPISKKPTNEDGYENDIGKWVGRSYHLSQYQKMDIMKRC
jgi:hypothetical protein